MKFLHTMIRVRDLDRSKEFYRTLGLELVRETEYPEGRFTLVFLKAPGDAGGEIELTHNWDRAEPYTPGDAWGHIAFAVEDIRATCDALRAQGVTIKREPGPMKHGTTVIAFIEDPDGHLVELIERKG
jgi:lactoylglutathione lyase